MKKWEFDTEIETDCILKLQYMVETENEDRLLELCSELCYQGYKKGFDVAMELANRKQVLDSIDCKIKE